VVFVYIAAFFLTGAVVYVVLGLLERNTYIEVDWVKPVCVLGAVSVIFLAVALAKACLDKLVCVLDDGLSKLKSKSKEKKTESRISDYEKLCGSFDFAKNQGRRDDDNGQ